MIAENNSTTTASSEAMDAEPNPAPPRRKGTMLIVDDEEGPRQSLRVIFKDDYDLFMASDGATAIELAQKIKSTSRSAIFAWPECPASRSSNG